MTCLLRGTLLLCCCLTLITGCEPASNPEATKPDATKPDTAKPESLTPEEADELVTGAVADWELDQKQAAKAKLERVMAAYPEHRTGLGVQGKVLHTLAIEQLQNGDYDQGLATMLEAEKSMQKLATSFEDLSDSERRVISASAYDLAGALAQGGKSEQAIERLQFAVRYGWNSADYMAMDENLDSLRELPGYQQLVAQLREQEVKAALQEMAEFRSFPFTFDLTDLNDKPLRLSDLRGKVVVVNIWGTWCPPCREEIPSFVRLHENYHEQGLEVVGLAFEQSGDKAEDTANVKEFAAQNKVFYTMALGEEKLLSQITAMHAFPTTIFIDRTGKVRMLMLGMRSYEALEAISKELLKEKTEEPAQQEPKTETSAEPMPEGK